MSQHVKLKPDSASAKIYTNTTIDYTLIKIEDEIAELSYERNGIPQFIRIPVVDVEQVEDNVDTPFLDLEVHEDMKLILGAIDSADVSALKAFDRIFARMAKLL